METSKNSNWLLIGALLFFLVSAGFTTINKSMASSPSNIGCWICDAIDTCKLAANNQIGQEDCQDFAGCSTWGPYCEPEDDDPGDDDPDEEG